MAVLHAVNLLCHRYMAVTEFLAVNEDALKRVNNIKTRWQVVDKLGLLYLLLWKKDKNVVTFRVTKDL